MQKFSVLTETEDTKLCGKASINLFTTMLPNVIGLKGRYSVYVNEEEQGSKLNTKGKSDQSIDPFKIIGTAVGIEWSFNHPIMTRKKLEDNSKTVNDYIPKRVVPLGSINESNIKLADENFQKHIAKIALQLVGPYRDVIKMNQDGLENGNDDESRRKLFMFQLNKTGTYFKLKEELKATVVQLVRSKFAHKSAFAKEADLQVFMSQVYVNLVDQMHVAINQLFKQPTKKVCSAFDLQGLEALATCAEEQFNFNLALTFRQEMIAKYPDNMNVWLEYGNYYMRRQEEEKGIECYKEIISRNHNHVNALLTYGSICNANEKHEEARVFFTTAIQNEPKSILANTIMVKYELT